MDRKTSTLPLPAAIDAAYLLLLGQLCFSISKLAFGITFVVENEVKIPAEPKSITIWILSFILVVVLFVNILSCWKSTRSTFDEIGHYPNSLLTADIFIIVAFFLLNSVASAPIGFTQSIVLDSKGISDFLSELTSLWKPVIPLLFLVSSLLVVSYRSWNVAYICELEKLDATLANDRKTNSLISFNHLYVIFSVIFFVFGIVQIFLDSFTMTLLFLITWILFWIYVNFSWILLAPTERT